METRNDDFFMPEKVVEDPWDKVIEIPPADIKLSNSSKGFHSIGSSELKLALGAANISDISNITNDELKLIYKKIKKIKKRVNHLENLRVKKKLPLSLEKEIKELNQTINDFDYKFYYTLYHKNTPDLKIFFSEYKPIQKSYDKLCDKLLSSELPSGMQKTQLKILIEKNTDVKLYLAELLTKKTITQSLLVYLGLLPVVKNLYKQVDEFDESLNVRLSGINIKISLKEFNLYFAITNALDNLINVFWMTNQLQKQVDELADCGGNLLGELELQIKINKLREQIQTWLRVKINTFSEQINEQIKILLRKKSLSSPHIIDEISDSVSKISHSISNMYSTYKKYKQDYTSYCDEYNKENNQNIQQSNQNIQQCEFNFFNEMMKKTSTEAEQKSHPSKEGKKVPERSLQQIFFSGSKEKDKKNNNSKGKSKEEVAKEDKGILEKSLQQDGRDNSTIGSIPSKSLVTVAKENKKVKNKKESKRKMPEKQQPCFFENKEKNTKIKRKNVLQVKSEEDVAKSRVEDDETRSTFDALSRSKYDQSASP